MALLKGLALLLCAYSASAFQVGPSVLGSRVQSRSACIAAPRRSGVAHASQHAKKVTSINMAVTLYGNRGSRSPLVEWYLQEIGTPYTHREDRAGLPNPFGQIPALIDDGVEIFESGAILLYLADKYGGLDTPVKRAAVTKWVVWANAALDPVLFTPNIEARAPKLLDTLDGILEGKKYLVGDTFSVADVAVASYLLFVPLFHPNFQMSRFPNVVEYMKTCVERPAYEKAFGPGAARARKYVAAQAGGQKKAFGLF